MSQNGLLMQYFEWYLPNEGTHWRQLGQEVNHLVEKGITMIWLPPFCKATSINDVGYGIYDLWDLGEFDQCGAVRTKYGTKEELLATINTLQEKGIAVVADVVLNHKANADEKESFHVLKMNPANRQEAISEPYEIEGWTHFYFPGRDTNYSNFEWHWYHFTGIDYDARHDEEGIFMILGDNKGWADNETVDDGCGNYDYLMFADIDYSHPEVRQHIKEWLRWVIEETGVSGVRFDAVKHINSSFIEEICDYLHKEFGEEFYLFGEYWVADLNTHLDYLDRIAYQMDLFDVALHMNLFQASQQGSDYDLSRIFEGSLVKDNPLHAVTFVNNHDTQLGQSLQSPVEAWFIQHAYALILLREAGLPTLFYGDYYGVGNEIESLGHKEQLDPILELRKDHAYGEQHDYFDHPNTIGWTRWGDEEHPFGIAVVLSNSQAGSKYMSMGALNAGAVFVDYLSNHPGSVQLDEEGNADFPVSPGSVSVWIKQDIFNEITNDSKEDLS